MSENDEKETQAKSQVRPFHAPRNMAIAQKEDFEHVDKLAKTNPYKAFVLIYAILLEQMRHALFFKFTKDEPSLRWRLILKHFRGFKLLVEVCFIAGIIDGELRDKLITFNRDRNETIGHLDPDLRKDISDEQVLRICERGLELMRDLLQTIQVILKGGKKP